MNHIVKENDVIKKLDNFARDRFDTREYKRFSI